MSGELPAWTTTTSTPAAPTLSSSLPLAIIVVMVIRFILLYNKLKFLRRMRKFLNSIFLYLYCWSKHSHKDDLGIYHSYVSICVDAIQYWIFLFFLCQLIFPCIRKKDSFTFWFTIIYSLIVLILCLYWYIVLIRTKLYKDLYANPKYHTKVAYIKSIIITFVPIIFTALGLSMAWYINNYLD